MPEEEDVVMLLPVVSETVFSRQMSEVVSAYEAEHEDNPLLVVARVIIFFWYV